MNIEDLLRSEKSRPGFSADARAVMWKGIESSIAGAAVVGATAAAATTAAAGAKTTAVTAAKIASWKIAALVSVALVAGAGAGAAAHARFGAPKIVVEHASTPIAIMTAAPVPSTLDAPPPLPLIAASALPSVPVPPAITSARAASPAASASAAPKDPGLARERALLDMARTALTRGDASSALTAVDTHAREFPKSQLGQEREVIAIQALAAAGRMPEAKRRAAAFHAAFPKSPLGAIIDEATQ